MLALALLFSLIALASSRAILLFHEFAGHGLAAIAVGGEVTGHRLFLFGGGWIRYHKDAGFDTGDQLVLALAGLAIEVALALAAIAASRRRQPGDPLRIAAVGFAGIALVHVGFYLAAGTHHGFGDGLVLHRLLGAWRTPVVLAASALAVVAAWWVARGLRGAIGGLPERRWRAAAVLGIASAAAVAVHGGLYLAERQITDDPTYADVMRAEAEREARRELASELARRRAAGEPMSSDEARRRERQLVAQRARFPIRSLLIGLVAIAAIAGALRRGPGAEVPAVRASDLLAPTAITAALLIAVAALARPFY